MSGYKFEFLPYPQRIITITALAYEKFWSFCLSIRGLFIQMWYKSYFSVIEKPRCIWFLNFVL